MLKLTQETRYPGRRCQNDGDPDKEDAFAINVRIPGWACNEAAPGDLYRFLDQVEEPTCSRSMANRFAQCREGIREYQAEVEEGRRDCLDAADARAARARRTSRSRRIEGAWRCSAAQLFIAPNGRTIRAAACATCCFQTARNSSPNSGPTCSTA